VPGWPGLEALGILVVPAMVIALVSFLETASSARVENQRDGRRWDDNQDLIGQGLAKLAAGACGTFAVSSSFSRSAINLYAGARTGWATVVTVGFVLATLLFLMPVLFHVPRAVLAAVVVVAVVNLVRPSAFRQLWRIAPVEAATAGVTFAVTLLTAPRIYWGVLAGVMMGLLHFLHHRLHPRIIEVGRHPDGSLRDRHLWHLPPLAPHLYALRMDAELDFAAARGFERAIVEHLATHPEVRHVCLFVQPINRIDATGVETFGQIRQQLLGPGHHPAHQRHQAARGDRAPPRGRTAGRADAEALPHRHRDPGRAGAPARRPARHGGGDDLTAHCARSGPRITPVSIAGPDRNTMA
jgi:SulP family sulfate permease